MATRHDREKQQRLNEKHKNILAVLLSREENKFCADCHAKGPRWASWNLGILLCIRCSGLHRSLGVHISRVKSVNLDTWTKDQMVNFCSRGNGWAKDYYEAKLPREFKRPQSDSNLEYFIRDKYERKKYISSSEIPLRSIKDLGLLDEAPPDLPQKTRRKDGRNREITSIAPIAKPKGLHPTSPAIPRPKSFPQLPQHDVASSVKPQATAHAHTPNTDDLLGINVQTPVNPPVQVTVATPPSADLTNDLFGPMSSYNDNAAHMTSSISSPDLLNGTANSAQEESTSSQPTVEKKMSKDSILSLYSKGTTNPVPNPMISSAGNFNMAAQGYQQQPPQQQAMPGFQGMQNMNMQGMQAAYASPQHQAMAAQQQMQQMTHQMANANISGMQGMPGYPMMGQQVQGNPMQNNMAFNMGYPAQTGQNFMQQPPQQQMYGGMQNGNMAMGQSPAMMQMGGYNPNMMGANVANPNVNGTQWGSMAPQQQGMGLNSGHTLSTHLWK